MAAKNNLNVVAMGICIQTGWYGGKNIPVGIEDVPGTGKTEIIEQLAKVMEAHLVAQDLATKGFTFGSYGLPQTMPEDIAGIPFLNQKEQIMERYPLAAIRECNRTEYGIILLDEVTSGSIATGAAAMTGVQSHRFGDTVLSDKTAIVGAWNPTDCAAGGREFAAPEINRYVKLTGSLATDEDFLDYLAGGPGAVAHVRFLDPDWEKKGMTKARTFIRHFLMQNRKAINGMTSKTTTEANSGQPWPSQRGWYNCTRLLAAVISLGEEPNSDLALTLMAGMVGDGMAEQFIGWVREMDLPDPEDILAEAMKPVKKDAPANDRANRIKACIPESVWSRPDKVRICLESVAIAAQSEHDDIAKRWEAAWHIMEPVIETKPDTAMGACKLLVNKKPAGAALPASATKLWKARSKAGLSRAVGRK